MCILYIYNLAIWGSIYKLPVLHIGRSVHLDIYREKVSSEVSDRIFWRIVLITKISSYIFVSVFCAWISVRPSLPVSTTTCLTAPCCATRYNTKTLRHHHHHRHYIVFSIVSSLSTLQFEWQLSYLLSCAFHGFPQAIFDYLYTYRYDQLLVTYRINVWMRIQATINKIGKVKSTPKIHRVATCALCNVAFWMSLSATN
jgi:hypothetical protein